MCQRLGGSRLHSRDSVTPSAIPVFLYGLETVLPAGSHQRGFWRATGYLEQVPGIPASYQYLHVYARLSFRYRVKPALLARLVPCLLSHIVVRTVRFRRLKSSTFLGNDSSAFSPKRRFSQICVGFIQVILRCVGVCMKLRLNQVRLVDPFGPYTCPAACCYRFYRGYLEFKSECQRGGCSALH